MLEEPLQVTILRAMKETFESKIVQGPNFHFTLGPNCFIGRSRFSERDPLPMLSILEVPLPPEERRQTRQVGSSVSGKWELFVQGFVEDDEDRDTGFETRRAYCLRDDVLCVLQDERRKLTTHTRSEYIFGIKRISDIYFDRGVVRPDDERSATSYFWVPLTIDIA